LEGGSILRDGRPTWVCFDDWDYDTTGFDEVLTDFCDTHGILPGHVGKAETLLLDQPALVDHATAAFRPRQV
jgi:aminoglycoside N3'-acetyltransferase